MTFFRCPYRDCRETDCCSDKVTCPKDWVCPPGQVLNKHAPPCEFGWCQNEDCCIEAVTCEIFTCLSPSVSFEYLVLYLVFQFFDIKSSWKHLMYSYAATWIYGFSFSFTALICKNTCRIFLPNEITH